MSFLETFEQFPTCIQSQLNVATFVRNMLQGIFLDLDLDLDSGLHSSSVFLARRFPVFQTVTSLICFFSYDLFQLYPRLGLLSSYGSISSQCRHHPFLSSVIIPIVPVPFFPRSDLLPSIAPHCSCRLSDLISLPDRVCLHLSPVIITTGFFWNSLNWSPLSILFLRSSSFLDAQGLKSSFKSSLRPCPLICPVLVP